jgi:protein involved in polysaccharide export with SLBB domain
VTIEGEVRQPGNYPWQQDMRVRDLVGAAGGLTRTTQQGRGEIFRLTPDGARRSFFFDLGAALRGLSGDNLLLEPGDHVMVRTLMAEEPLFPPSVPAAFPREGPGVPGAAIRPRPPVEDLSAAERLLAGFLPALALPLRQFGYELFGQVPTTFAPVIDVPVGPDYVVGPGDTLNVILWGSVQEAYQAEVDRNGAIAIPRLGVVQVWGMTLERLQTFLQRRFSEFYTDFQMAVTLGKLRTIRVFVVGEVQQPGSYTVSSLSTMISALFVSGGPSKNGSLRQIRLMRNGKEVATLDLYDFLLQGDKSQDRALQSGDTIFVPVIGAVAGVAGNVKRPAIYEIAPGMTLRRLLELAGGVAPSGYLQRVHVERFVANERKSVVDLDLSSAPSPAAGVWHTPIQDGDVVRVLPIATRLENVVQLEGHVLRPGRYELKPGMRLLDLLPSYDALLSEPYVEYAEIIRHVPPDLRRTVVSFNLQALLAGEAAHNLDLQPQDTVRVFARDDFVDARLARISGLVHRPGLYPLTDGMRVRDLVLRAENVHKLAYLDSAELTRQAVGSTKDLTIRVEINLAKALAGDPEHNLLLQDFDHLLVRQVPGVILQDDTARTETGRVTAIVPSAPGEQVAGRPAVPQTIPVFPLQRGDPAAAAVLQRAGILQEPAVELRGELRFPGLYPIQPGERLSSVLRRAGGFTTEAYLRGAVLTRVSVRESQQRRLDELLREEEQALLTEGAVRTAAALTSEEVQGRQEALAFRRDLLTRLRAAQPEGRIVVRLQPLDAFAGSVQDIELEPGDRLVVPQTPKYVSVLGQVYNRTSLIYEPGKDLAHYLERVGGIRPEANAKEIHLVQVDGTVISRSQDRYLSIQPDGRTTYLGDFFAIQPQPGDTIVVPRRIETPATLRTVRDIVQIIFQSIGTLGVIAALL